VFVAIIAYLLNILNSVKVSERVIGKSQQVSKLSAEMETGMRGFLLSADDTFLEPYLAAVPHLPVELQALENMVQDRPVEVERIRRIASAQAEWQKYAAEIIARKR
jgi:CHASE3 domain sensor protein